MTVIRQHKKYIIESTTTTAQHSIRDFQFSGLLSSKVGHKHMYKPLKGAQKSYQDIGLGKKSSAIVDYNIEIITIPQQMTPNNWSPR